MTALRKALSIQELDIGSPAELAVTVWNFDGVHLGHLAVLAELRRVVAESGRRGVAVTFDPHPLAVVAPGRAPRLLAPLDERLELIASAGVEDVLVVPFTAELASSDGDAFLRDIGVGEGSHVVLGYDFHMGRDRSSGIDSLRELGRRVGFDLNVVPAVLFEGEAISSSRIRAAVSRGDIEAANLMLGRPYLIRGAVVRGDGIGGSVLGVATANIETHALKLLPADGVYYIEETPETRAGVLYIGRRPTFGKGERRVEVHLLDVDADLYGTELCVGVLRRIRRDRQFADASRLSSQIEEDIAAARSMAAARGVPEGGTAERHSTEERTGG